MRGKRETIPDWLLERYLLGELDTETTMSIRTRIEEDPECAIRYGELLASNEEILAAYPPDEIVMKIERKQNREIKKPERSMMRVFSLAAALLAIVVAAVIVLPEFGTTGHFTENDKAIRFKGTPSLTIYRKTEAGYDTIKTSARVRKGDRFQIKYRAGDKSYGVIISIDGAGYVTLHFPDTQAASPALEKGGEIALDEAFELDSAPGFERFFFVTSEIPFDVGNVVAQARAVARNSESARSMDLDLPDGFNQQSILLIKGEK
ncbi:MAG: hypothetical protein JW881_02945 [Spirochaetales bacterium]|nr:hypothetical protein [Spirochaetales bacterium]